jgi:hypothetical protein
MSGSGRFGRGGWLAWLALGALPGCQDVGLPGRNTAEGQAAVQPFRYVVYDMAAPAGAPGETVTEIAPATDAASAAPARSQHWLPSGATVAIPDRLLRPVGGTGASVVYALSWDTPPYDRLFAAAREAGVYHPLHPVPPVATPPAAAEAGDGTGH